MKKLFITLMVGLALIVPAFGQQVSKDSLSDGCLSPDEWAVSMAAQGLSPVALIELSDGFFQVYRISEELFMLFPFDMDRCGMPNVAPVTMDAVRFYQTFGIIIS